MGEREFWEIIGLADWSREGDDEAVTEGMVRHLASLSDEEIFAFDDALAEHLRALDRRDVAERAFGHDRDRFFPDEFLGWRCACVAGGRGCWEDALAGRSAPPAGARFEELMFAPMRAWPRRHGTNPEAYPHRPVPSCQAFGNRDGWAW